MIGPLISVPIVMKVFGYQQYLDTLIPETRVTAYQLQDLFHQGDFTIRWSRLVALTGTGLFQHSAALAIRKRRTAAVDVGKPGICEKGLLVSLRNFHGFIEFRSASSFLSRLASPAFIHHTEFDSGERTTR